MSTMLTPFRTLEPAQRRVFIACFLGWTLDAFDFFLLTYTLDAVAASFAVSQKTATTAIFWTLCMRPLGAFLFGFLAERYGRRPTLMLNVVCFSIFELLSAFAPSFHSFLILRALFGIAMGGEWGVGAALALETLPAGNRGFFAGLLQEGYAVGNLLAAAAYGLMAMTYGGHRFAAWRLLFVLGALPSLLVLYIRAGVAESPAWQRGRDAKRGLGRPMAIFTQLGQHMPLLLMLMLLMTGLNSLSHGTQDLYPTFLKTVHHLSPRVTSAVATVATLGAVCGGPVWGAVSERWGRRRALAVAALLTIPVIPLWIWSHSLLLLGLGGFAMQFMVQGAWGRRTRTFERAFAGAVACAAARFGVPAGQSPFITQCGVADRFSDVGLWGQSGAGAGLDCRGSRGVGRLHGVAWAGSNGNRVGNLTGASLKAQAGAQMGPRWSQDGAKSGAKRHVANPSSLCLHLFSSGSVCLHAALTLTLRL